MSRGRRARAWRAAGRRATAVPLAAALLAAMLLVPLASASTSRAPSAPPAVPPASLGAVAYVDAALGYQGLAGDGSLGASVSGSAFAIDPVPSLAPGCAAPEGTLLLVTNAHVVRSANDLRVTLFEAGSGEEAAELTLPATILAADDRADLALLAVAPGALAARGASAASARRLRLASGPASELPPGEEVLAEGSPLGLKRTITRGIVSVALQPVEESPFRLVQTDAAINPGNSGGPLVRARTGEVVGVSTLRESDVDNIGFAIPAQRVRTFLRAALCGGGVRHATIAVATEPVEARMAEALGLDEQRGAIVVRRLDRLVERPVPLEPLDVVLEVRGPRQAEAGGGLVAIAVEGGGAPLSEALFDLEPGAPAALTVWRRGERLVVPVPLAPLDLNAMTPALYFEAWGAIFEEIPWDMRYEDDYPGRGALVGAVRPGTPAAAAELAPYEVVEELLVRDGERLQAFPVASLADLRRVAPEVDAAVAAARRAGRAPVLGIKVYDLESRAHAIRFLGAR
ncbi:MAG: trypsin-like peptidase domain-containing protein [Acidobacteria bacterium]|nr:trypsin-like peptidase domain-containing protein [Acidobacteriota bacterium]